MKKVLSLIVALALVAALAVSMSAAAIDNLPAEQEMKVNKAAVAPKIDGMFDKNVYGAPLWSFSGQDAWDVDANGGAAADYTWNLWPDSFEATASAEPAKATKFSGYACWDENNLYMYIEVDMGSNPFYYNPTPDWQGNGIQLALCPVEAWVDENSQVEWGFSFADAASTSAITYRAGIFSFPCEDVAFSCVYDGSAICGYEFAFEFAKFEVTGAAGLQMFFCASVNVNIADDLSTDDFNGYQVGQGVYNGKGAMGDSHILVMVDEAAEAPAEEPAEEPAEQPAEEPAEQPAEEPAEQPAEEPAEEKPVDTKPAQTADVSAVMYVLATLSTIGGAIVLKRK